MTAWFGSKATSGLSQAIIAAMPPHDVYIEPFLGGGAIMKRKPPAIRNIGIDLDRRALKGFDGDGSVELRHGCALRFLEAFPFQGHELVYCDPPYLQATRRSRAPLPARFRRRGACGAADAPEVAGLPGHDLRDTRPGSTRRTLPAGVRCRCRSTTMRRWSPRPSGSTSSPTGCTGPGSPAGTSPTARWSGARPRNWGRRYAAMPQAERLAVLAAVMAVEAG